MWERHRAMDTTLPQLSSDRVFLTDGGLETSLIFHQGLDLPVFAAFPLLETESGRDSLRKYFGPFLEVAREQGSGFVLDTPTWRANADWGAEIGYDAAALDRINRDAVAFAQELRDEAALDGPVVINGVVGPRGDGYVVGAVMSPDEAERYHSAQIGSFV